MCEAEPPHAGPPPPPGETWCPVRLRIEMQRWWLGFPMRCGPVRPITLDQADT